MMRDPVEPLILDLVASVATRPRPYAEVIDAWRTSCPRLTVWEEATARGYVAFRWQPDGALTISATREGRCALSAAGRHLTA